MIDFDTIEDIEECDGEAIHAYGFNPETKSWEWAWVQIEDLAEAGRIDIVERVMG